MNRHRLLSAALVTALLAGLPGAATAQDEPTSPEGVDWALTSYYDEEVGELVDVPPGVEPTLRLEDGMASGSGGCNRFSGSYELDGGSLRFDEEMSVTLALCTDPAQSVENVYLAALGEVDGWTIDLGTLELNDDFGDVILTFDLRGAALTASQILGLMTAIEELQTRQSELQTAIDALRTDTERLNVPRLRERIKALEAENKAIREQLDELVEAPTVEPTAKPSGPTTFSAAESVLLKGIPTRIASRCNPLRSALPKGTKAAVTCTPNTNVVSSVSYYLLEGDAAARAFGTEMTEFNVPEATAAGQTCEQGVKSQRHWFDNGWQADGCYRTNSRAEVRFIDNATDCRKLRVGGKTMASPAFLIALQGASNDVAGVHAWATRGLPDGSPQLTSITQPIPSNLGASTSCPT